MPRIAFAVIAALALGAGALAQGLPEGSRIADQEPLPRLNLALAARGVPERDAFLVAFGHALFRSPEIMGTTAREAGISCATCHNNGDANRDLFIPGLSTRPGGVDVTTRLFHPFADNGVFDPVDIPSLRGVRFTAPYGRDGRIATLREFVAMVITTEFDGPEPTSLMLDALVAFLDQLDFLPTPFLDRGGRLNARASAAAKRGETIFTTNCASCHDPAAQFIDGKRHDVGSGGIFDTPTLLGVTHTAPYLHDGRLATLGAVVDWFDAQFGLRLAAGEKSDLTAYLESVGTGERPYQEFAGSETPIRARMREDSVFTSTLDALIPRRDRFHSILLVRSVARDLRTETAAKADAKDRPRALDLADRLDRIGAAVLDNDWDEAARRWAEYRAVEKTGGAD